MSQGRTYDEKDPDFFYYSIIGLLALQQVSRREEERQAAQVARDRAYQNSDRAKITGRFARENDRVRAFNRRMDAKRA